MEGHHTAAKETLLRTAGMLMEPSLSPFKSARCCIASMCPITLQRVSEHWVIIKVEVFLYLEASRHKKGLAANPEVG